jgi:hypothetical protein
MPCPQQPATCPYSQSDKPPFYAHQFYLFSITLPPTPRSCKAPLSFEFLNQNLCAFFSFPTCEEHRKMTQKQIRQRISTLHYVGGPLQYQMVLPRDTVSGTFGIRKLNGPTAGLNTVYPKLTTGRLDLHEAWSVVLCEEIKTIKHTQEECCDSKLHYPNIT